MIRFSSWGMGLVVFSASLSAFAQDAEPAPAADTAAPAPAGGTAVADASASSGGYADKKIRLGLRLGYALPMGSVADGSKMSDLYSGQIPIWIDAGYMVTPNILVGLYGQYGFVSVKNCPTGVSCSAHDLRFGVQGQYHIMPTQSADPWLGLGVGYESLSTSLSGGGLSVDGSVTGLEFLNLQGGADFKIADAFAVGPFLSFSLGEYSSATGGSIDKKAMHEWLTFGVKGTFGL
jgi:hypothetical protein